MPAGLTLHASRPVLRPLRAIPFLLLMLTLVDCGRNGDADRAEVSFMIFGDPADLAAYERLVEAFELEHPGIAIALRHVPSQGDYQRRLAAEFAAGAPPDVMLLNYRRIATLAQEGGLAPITSYLASSAVIQESGFYGLTVEAFTLAGELWCLPQNVSSLAVFYNRDLFDAAELDYPADDWTRDEFLALARALTADRDADGRIDQYGVGITPNLLRLAPLIWQDGGELVDDPATPTRLALDSPAALGALRWFVDLQVREGVVPDAVAELAESSESRFLNGRLGMIFNSRRVVPTYRTITGFEWDVAPLPRGRSAAGILHSDGYCMAAAAGNKESAWTFIEFANSAAGQELMAATGRTVPSLRSVARSPAYSDPLLPPANSRVFLDAIPTLGRVPVLPGWPAVEEIANREIERAFYGRVSVEEAAAAAVALTLPYLNP